MSEETLKRRIVEVEKERNLFLTKWVSHMGEVRSENTRLLSIMKRNEDKMRKMKAVIRCQQLGYLTL